MARLRLKWKNIYLLQASQLRSPIKIKLINYLWSNQFITLKTLPLLLANNLLDCGLWV
jgi:hypothetical protein